MRDSAPTRVLDQAPWLLDPALGTCVVGSVALAEACRRAGIESPQSHDLDLAWALDPEAGTEVLREHGVWMPSTPANLDRGTLAFKIGRQRIEITTFRGTNPSTPIEERILADLGARDMTIGALAWRLSDDHIFDPSGGLDHWRERRIVPVGHPMDRINEHPVRWLRYYRRTHQWQFALDASIERLAPDPEILQQILPEALAGEFRAALLDLPSPGKFFIQLHERGLLLAIAPELDPMFDGRPAGPERYHPEISQAQHMILALEWIAANARDLPVGDRLTATLCVLCHDLGKGLTPADEFPSHRGHEGAGRPLVKSMLDRLPGLADAQTRRMAEIVCELHLTARRLAELRHGTLVRLYDRFFRQKWFRADLFALALGADVAGRLGREQEGVPTAQGIEEGILKLCNICGDVDARALKEKAGDDLGRFRDMLHEARARAVASAFSAPSSDG